MKTTTIEEYFAKNLKIDEQKIHQLLYENQTNFNRIKVKKGEIIMHQGELCQHTFFVEEGLLRYYSIDTRGKEHILHFAPEGWFISDRDSIYFNQPTNYFTEALEDSTIVKLEKNFFPKIFDESSNFFEFNEHLLHSHIRQLQKRITLLLSATAEERYLDFIEIYPDILLRVPQWMVASYLGITPEGLSRVRKDLANKWKNQ
ncbi:MAG: Crp/Fnr family transcriptional regulator [Crocinitomicaceae bacterium]|nr:Crp/Fnr family transcriptional regulator [Crocinitomicaceae bacterium]